jgi:hypothetical protein
LLELLEMLELLELNELKELFELFALIEVFEVFAQLGVFEPLFVEPADCCCAYDEELLPIAMHMNLSLGS